MTRSRDWSEHWSCNRRNSPPRPEDKERSLQALPPARLLVDDCHDPGEGRRCRRGPSYNSRVEQYQVAVAVGCGLTEALEAHQVAVVHGGGSQGDIRNIALPILWYPWNPRVLPTGFAVNLARASAAGKE